MLEMEGKIRMPKQEVKPDQTHGYVGEAEGLVETFDPPKSGSSNTVPDVKTAEARVDAAKRQLDAAQRSLDEANKAAKSKPADTTAKPPVGGTT